MRSSGDWARQARGRGEGSSLMCPFPTTTPRLESGREDERLRCDELEREVAELQHRNQALTSLAQEAQALKDEMDELR